MDSITFYVFLPPQSVFYISTAKIYQSKIWIIFEIRTETLDASELISFPWSFSVIHAYIARPQPITIIYIIETVKKIKFSDFYLVLKIFFGAPPLGR